MLLRHKQKWSQIRNLCTYMRSLAYGLVETWYLMFFHAEGSLFGKPSPDQHLEQRPERHRLVAASTPKLLHSLALFLGQSPVMKKKDLSGLTSQTSVRRKEHTALSAAASTASPHCPRFYQCSNLCITIPPAISPDTKPSLPLPVNILPYTYISDNDTLTRHATQPEVRRLLAKSLGDDVQAREGKGFEELE